MSDLIRREDAINAVEMFFKDAYIEDADVHCTDMVYEINHIPAAPRWVSCEERLPEKCKWVLAISTFEKVTLYNIATVDAGGTWWTTSPKDIMREIYCVTHWMPIEPPKEEEHGN